MSDADARRAHGRAAATMVLVALLWSIAGVVSRYLQTARSFEVNFWRSAFAAGAVGAAIVASRGVRGLLRDVREGGWPLAASSLAWSVMFTGFMVAIMVADVATVLVTLSIGPLVTAVAARAFLGHRLAPRTWWAIGAAGAGIAWMFAAQTGGARAGGVLAALTVPFAAAANYTVLQHVQRRHAREPSLRQPAMLPAVMLGGVISAAATAVPAWPWAATPRDLALLALLGVVQLAIPCLLVVRVTRRLAAPEIALIGLLEVIFGVAWAWIGAGERPSARVLQGGALVVAALVVNETLALRERAA